MWVGMLLCILWQKTTMSYVDRVTRCVLEKSAQNVAQRILCLNYCITFNVVQSSYKIWARYFCNLQKYTQSKQLPNRRKFANLVTLYVDTGENYRLPIFSFSACVRQVCLCTCVPRYICSGQVGRKSFGSSM
jgi:hypothetical protein